MACLTRVVDGRLPDSPAVRGAVTGWAPAGVARRITARWSRPFFHRKSV